MYTNQINKIIPFILVFVIIAILIQVISLLKNPANDKISLNSTTSVITPTFTPTPAAFTAFTPTPDALTPTPDALTPTPDTELQYINIFAIN